MFQNSDTKSVHSPKSWNIITTEQNKNETLKTYFPNSLSLSGNWYKSLDYPPADEAPHQLHAGLSVIKLHMLLMEYMSDILNLIEKAFISRFLKFS